MKHTFDLIRVTFHTLGACGIPRQSNALVVFGGEAQNMLNAFSQECED